MGKSLTVLCSSPPRPSREKRGTILFPTSGLCQFISGTLLKLRGGLELDIGSRVNFNESLPYSACKDIVIRLLDKDERTRFGSRSGASEVKQHKWFAKMNWGLLRHQRPPVSLICSYISLSRKCVGRLRRVFTLV